MRVSSFVEAIKKEKIAFFTGVPDSQLKHLCNCIMKEEGVSLNHMVAPNEGSALALAAGEYLATGRPACVYLQNSGLGNLVNPMCSLMHREVYGIPALFVVGWRGEPGVHDEPQHVFQGQVTLETLELLGIEALVLSPESEESAFLQEFHTLCQKLRQGKCVAVVVKKGAFEGTDKPDFHSVGTLEREAAVATIAGHFGDGALCLSTTGKISRELFEQREFLGQPHDDFLTVGSMGHCSSIALRVAQRHPEKTVLCLDGDGALLMHLGALTLIGANHPANLLHIVLDNGAHETVGGIPTVSSRIDPCQIAKACGYPRVLSVSSEAELKHALELFEQEEKLTFLHVKVALGSRDDLGRPTRTPIQNRDDFMKKAGAVQHQKEGVSQ